MAGNFIILVIISDIKSVPIAGGHKLADKLAILCIYEKAESF